MRRRTAVGGIRLTYAGPDDEQWCNAAAQQITLFFFYFSEFWMYNYFLRKFGLYEFVAQFMFEGFFSNFLFTGLA